MKIVIMEPLGISAEKLAAVTEPLKAAGHEITAYDTKLRQIARQDRRITRLMTLPGAPAFTTA